MTAVEGADRERGSTGPVPVRVLTYHSLDSSGSVISITPDAFRRQIESLREWGYQGITLGRLVEAWAGKAPLPPRPVVLTFDDAFGNFADHARPVLVRCGFRATLFAVAGHCGGHNNWPTQPAGVPRLPLLSWGALRDLSDEGFEVGAHSLTHPRLPELLAAEAAREVADGRTILEDRLGREVSSFAYPYGLADELSRTAAATHYRAACGVRLGTARPSSDRFDLPRVDMYYLRDPRVFRLFPSRAGSLYLKLRAAGRACRGLLRFGVPSSGPKGTHP